MNKYEFVERFPELSLFYRLFSLLNMESRGKSNHKKTKCTAEKDIDRFRKSVRCIITMEGINAEAEQREQRIADLNNSVTIEITSVF